jgi:hypothetical protein
VEVVDGAVVAVVPPVVVAVVPATPVSGIPGLLVADGRHAFWSMACG